MKVPRVLWGRGEPDSNPATGRALVSVFPVGCWDPSLRKLSGTVHFDCLIEEGEYGRKMSS